MNANLWFLFSLAHNLSLSNRHQKFIKMQLILFKMMKFSLKRSHYSLNTPFEWEKLSFDDFLMMTWEREVESQRRKKPQIPRQNGFSHRKLKCQLLYPIFYAAIMIVPPLTVYIQKRYWLCYWVELPDSVISEEQFLCADEQKRLEIWKFKWDFRNPSTPLCQFIFLRELAGFLGKQNIASNLLHS